MPFIRSVVVAAVALIAFLPAQAFTAATQWKPEQPIEIVLGTAPGSGPDRNARVMQKIFQAPTSA
jgi:tripartite-type tricarboxylate transporter receptor subunit TctC